MRRQERSVRSRKTHRIGVLLLLCAMLSTFCVAAPKSESEVAHKRREALSKFNQLIGGWRGVGRQSRGVDGAWTEKAEWVWAFEEQGPSIKLVVEDGQLFKEGELFWVEAKKEFRLATQLRDGRKLDFRGKFEKGKRFTMASPAAKDGGDNYRLHITMLNQKRTLLRMEKQTAGRGSFRRMADVGYTRAGTRLAKDGLGGPECVVTGGLGTIEVKFEGKSYYVCCTGCKQVFDDDPAGTLAAYKEWKAREDKEENATKGESS